MLFYSFFWAGVQEFYWTSVVSLTCTFCSLCSFYRSGDWSGGCWRDANNSECTTELQMPKRTSVRPYFAKSFVTGWRSFLSTRYSFSYEDSKILLFLLFIKSIVCILYCLYSSTVCGNGGRLKLSNGNENSICSWLSIKSCNRKKST